MPDLEGEDEFEAACLHLASRPGHTAPIRAIVLIVAGCKDRDEFDVAAAAEVAGVTTRTARLHLRNAERAGFIERDDTRGIGWRIKRFSEEEQR